MSDPELIRNRRAGRVLVIDPDGRLLLLHGFDPVRPDEPFWFTAGGGAKPGEDLAEAAARELLEETGIEVTPAALGVVVWREVSEFSYQHRAYRQENEFFALRVPSAAISTDGMDDEEAATVDGYRWWTIAELEATTESYYPAALPRLLRDLTAP